MTQQADFNAVMQHLAAAVDPLGDAATLFVDPDFLGDTVKTEDIEAIGQAILTALMSISIALQGLAKLITAPPVTLGDLVE